MNATAKAARFKEEPRYQARAAYKGGYNVVDVHRMIAVDIGLDLEEAKRRAAKRNEERKGK